MSATLVAETLFQAALSISVGAKISVLSALYDAVKRVQPDANTYTLFKECVSIVSTLFGQDGLHNYTYNGGYSGKCWPAPESKTLMITVLLMCYEYVVQEMGGSRVS